MKIRKRIESSDHQVSASSAPVQELYLVGEVYMQKLQSGEVWNCKIHGDICGHYVWPMDVGSAIGRLQSIKKDSPRSIMFKLVPIFNPKECKPCQKKNKS